MQALVPRLAVVLLPLLSAVASPCALLEGLGLQVSASPCQGLAGAAGNAVLCGARQRS